LDPPEVPTCGTSSAPLVDLLAWHAKIYATKCEFASVLSVQTSAILAAQSATTQLEVAEALEAVAGSRVTEAGLRCESAWRNYTKLYSLATLADLPLVSGRGRGKSKGVDKGKGKGKARALPPIATGSGFAGTDVKGDNEEEVVSRELVGNEEMFGGPENPMELS
jgi:hypothetical protein